MILEDSRSTHSFLDAKIAKALKVLLVKVLAIFVTMADDGAITSSNLCPAFSWEIQQYSFNFDLRLLEIESFDVF